MLNRLQPLSYSIWAVGIGSIIGFCVQLLLTSLGYSIFTPLWAQGAVLLVIGMIVLLLAGRLKKELVTKRTVAEPLKAVRVLAAARAGQLLCGLGAGLGLGLFFWILPRFAELDLALWAPMLLLTLLAFISWGLCLIAERWCRVPPADEDENSEGGNYSAGAEPQVC